MCHLLIEEVMFESIPSFGILTMKHTTSYQTERISYILKAHAMLQHLDSFSERNNYGKENSEFFSELLVNTYSVDFLFKTS